jgi:hypothetical protein
MHIQRPLELLYAIHILARNDLDSLMLEVDEDLKNGEYYIVLTFG